ncbi:hypothetical protein FACS1894204_04260 [Synergistales bacterium]|nr:hypothetical protein FACS1894204_04260 [Synergistales bacterium]
MTPNGATATGYNDAVWTTTGGAPTKATIQNTGDIAFNTALVLKSPGDSADFGYSVTDPLGSFTFTPSTWVKNPSTSVTMPISPLTAASGGVYRMPFTINSTPYTMPSTRLVVGTPPTIDGVGGIGTTGAINVTEGAISKTIPVGGEAAPTVEIFNVSLPNTLTASYNSGNVALSGNASVGMYKFIVYAHNEYSEYARNPALRTYTVTVTAPDPTPLTPAQILAQHISSTTTLTATAAGSTVSVSGSATGLNQLFLDTTPDSNLKINWNTSYSGNLPLPLITVLGSGTIEITNSASITNNNTNSGSAITSEGDVIITGGSITANGAYSTAIFTEKNVSMSGGTVTANGSDGIALFATGNVSLTGGSIYAQGERGYAVHAGGTVTTSEGVKISSTMGIKAGGGIIVDKSGGGGGGRGNGEEGGGGCDAGFGFVALVLALTIGRFFRCKR